ncbi:hypothetical protein PsYK624_000060 [Phanerochaete sordida]|uniref:Uncharacterized protein n=1 Tax=Phanerochaete sordida TaxID=48140 RepID=A0A9P3FWM7_9APHY|nr:hypothetical protein PsYK624_000060 [Phanerochaete sordida]
MLLIVRLHDVQLLAFRSLANAICKTLLGAIFANVWQIAQRLAVQYKRIWPFTLLYRPVLYRRYASKDAEQEYWRAVEKAKQRLQASNAHAPVEGLLVYYVPKLLPEYRDAKQEDPEAKEEYISPRTFCKWHRMVFPGQVRHTSPPQSRCGVLTVMQQRQPTLTEAVTALKSYSSRDRREMRRIARLQSDHAVFHRIDTSARYGALWRTWLASKGPDAAVVFAPTAARGA